MTTPTHKPISAVDEHEDQPGQTLITRDHDVIRAWTAARGAVPARVPNEAEGTLPEVTLGGLPEARRDDDGDPVEVEEISWTEWFTVFDHGDLRFAYREHEADGSPSTYFVVDTSSRDEG